MCIVTAVLWSNSTKFDIKAMPRRCKVCRPAPPSTSRGSANSSNMQRAFILRPSRIRVGRSTQTHRVCPRRLSSMNTSDPQLKESREQLLRRKGYRPGDKVIIFDGVCIMCNTGVDFVLQNDPKRQFKFAALQSEAGKALAERFRCPSDLSTMVYIEGDEAFVRSDAMLRIGRRLGWFFSIPSELALLLVPKRIRDFVYTDVIAKYRYKVFGKRDECRFVQSGEERRFLD